MSEPRLLNIAQAARRAPGSPSPVTLWRWCRKGILARNGERVRLAHVRLGRRVYVEEPALLDFARRVAEADLPAFEAEPTPRQAPASSPGERSLEERERAAQAAAERIRHGAQARPAA